jgi:hypothetical protein
MKKITTMKRLLSLLLVVGGFMFVLPSSALASSTLSFSPQSAVVTKDAPFRVSVYVNTGGDKVNALQADVAYPADKLQFLSISTSGTALTIFAEKSGGGGIVHLSGGTPSPGFSGNKLVATITFKALSDSGAASLAFTSDSAVLRDSDNTNILTAKGTASYTLAASSTPHAATSISPSTTQVKPTAAPEANGITGLMVENMTSEGVTLVWKTKTKSDSTIEFGETTEYGYVQNDKTLVTDHRILIPSEFIKAGQLYYFVAKSIDARGNELTSEASTFKPKGFEVVVRVRDSKEKAVMGATVTLYSDVQSKETDENGEAKFTDVSSGTHGLVVKQNNQTVIREVVVKDDATAATVIDIPFTTKNGGFDFDMSAISSLPITNTMLYGFLAGVLILATLLVIVYIVKARKKYEEEL